MKLTIFNKEVNILDVSFNLSSVTLALQKSKNKTEITGQYCVYPYPYIFSPPIYNIETY